MADAIAESVAHLQVAVDQITSLVMADQKPSREMIVAFQAFDRLKQEFEGLSNALRHYADANATGDHSRVAANAIASITVSDLKERLENSLSSPDEALPGESGWEEEKIF